MCIHLMRRYQPSQDIDRGKLTRFHAPKAVVKVRVATGYCGYKEASWQNVLWQNAHFI